MDILDYIAYVRPNKKKVELKVRTYKDVDAMNSGIYFRSEMGELIHVPYRDLGQVMWFTEPGVFHVFLFHKDTAWVRVRLRRYFKENDMAQFAKMLQKNAFEELGVFEPIAPFSKEEKNAIRAHDRQAMRDAEAERDEARQAQ